MRTPALKTRLRAVAKPVKYEICGYSQNQRKFLSNYVKKLLQRGVAFSNPNSNWVSAPFPVPKPETKLRFTVELRRANKFTNRHQFSMLPTEKELTKLNSSTVYVTFDLSHGYRQPNLAAYS